jgi:hypothetical protein
MAMQRLREAAEKAKIELSSTTTATINLPYITVDADKNPLFLHETLSRGEFQRITSGLLARIRDLSTEIVRETGTAADDIDHVILAGGATCMPAVVDLVKEVLGGREPARAIDPDEVVAVGAALQAGVLRGEVAKNAPLLGAGQRQGTGGIFISYRRSDEPGFAGRLYDRLAGRFGVDQIFMDVDSIELGLDFGDELERSLNSCRVLVAVIGRGWLDAKDDDDVRRLDNPADWVRMEIASALRRGIRVIPILVDGARMPRATELPAELAPLARRNAHSMSHSRFGADTLELISTIEQVLSR